jgi:hypothetical protein
MGGREEGVSSEITNAFTSLITSELLTRQPTESSYLMSLYLCLVSQIMYLREGEVTPGDEAKVERYEKKLANWKRDFIDVVKSTNQRTKEEISGDMFKVGNSFDGYWCEGEKCLCERTHWVLYYSKTCQGCDMR